MSLERKKENNVESLFHTYPPLRRLMLDNFFSDEDETP